MPNDRHFLLYVTLKCILFVYFFIYLLDNFTMQVIKGRRNLFLYSFGAFGVNLLNLVVGSYLCSALIVTGFGPQEIANHTFAGVTLVSLGLWAVLTVVAKIIDGLIDIPMAHFTDRLRSRWGRRRPAIVLGLIPMVIAYVLFAVIPILPTDGFTEIWSTIFYFSILALFYTFYTLTMVTYYATFTEIVDNEADRRYLTNMKSIADIVYFIVGFALVPILLKGINIRWVALIVLPFVLLMLIPLFMMKEESTKDGVKGPIGEDINLVKSFAITFKNKDFIIWMIVYSFMTFGLQLFLSGINEYFSIAGFEMIYVMAASFAPVPLTFKVYNMLIEKKGFRFAYQYTLIIFAISMLAMFGMSYLEQGTLKLVLSILIAAFFTSFSIGAMFAVAYSIPSQIAADEEKKTGISHSAMYFAVQGLFSGAVAGLGGGAFLTFLKGIEIFSKAGTYYITVFSAISCLIAFGLCFALPKSIALLGRKNKEKKDDDEEVPVENKDGID